MKSTVLIFLALCLTSFNFSTTKNPDRDRDKFTLVLDAAHGGKDPGFSAFDQTEKDIVLKLCQKIRELNNNPGVQVLLTRADDVYVDFNTRVSTAEEISPDLLISLHINGSEDVEQSGMEAIVSGDDEISTEYGRSVLEVLASDFKNLGVSASNQLFILNKTSCPAMVLELGYLSNRSDMEKLTSEDTLDKIAKTILAELPVE